MIESLANRRLLPAHALCRDVAGELSRLDSAGMDSDFLTPLLEELALERACLDDPPQTFDRNWLAGGWNGLLKRAAEAACRRRGADWPDPDAFLKRLLEEGLITIAGEGDVRQFTFQEGIWECLAARALARRLADMGWNARMHCGRADQPVMTWLRHWGQDEARRRIVPCLAACLDTPRELVERLADPRDDDLARSGLVLAAEALNGIASDRYEADEALRTVAPAVLGEVVSLWEAFPGLQPRLLKAMAAAAVQPQQGYAGDAHALSLLLSARESGMSGVDETVLEVIAALAPGARDRIIESTFMPFLDREPSSGWRLALQAAAMASGEVVSRNLERILPCLASFDEEVAKAAKAATARLPIEKHAELIRDRIREGLSWDEKSQLEDLLDALAVRAPEEIRLVLVDLLTRLTETDLSRLGYGLCWKLNALGAQAITTLADDLLPLLKHENADLRLMAANVLWRADAAWLAAGVAELLPSLLRERQDVQTTLKLLYSLDPEIQQAFLDEHLPWIFQHLAKDLQLKALEFLKEPRVQRMVLPALAHRHIMPLLVHPDADIRAAACRTMNMLTGEKLAEFMPVLLSHLDDQRVDVRSHALSLLKKVPAERLEPHVLRIASCLHDESWNIVGHALELPSRQDVDLRIPLADQLFFLLERAEEQDLPNVARWALKCLADLPQEVLQHHKNAFYKFIFSKDMYASPWGFLCYINAATPDEIALLLHELLKNPVHAAEYDLEKAFVRLGKEAQKEILWLVLPLAQHHEDHVRKKAFRLFKTAGGDCLLDMLDRLEDDGPVIRYVLPMIAGRLDADAATRLARRLAARLEREAEAWRLTGMLEMMAALPSEALPSGLAQVLGRLLSEGPDDVRSSVIRLLRNLPQTERDLPVDAVLPLLQEDDALLIAETLSLLQEHREEDRNAAACHVLPLLGHIDPLVRERAKAFLLNCAPEGVASCAIAWRPLLDHAIPPSRQAALEVFGHMPESVIAAHMDRLTSLALESDRAVRAAALRLLARLSPALTARSLPVWLAALGQGNALAFQALLAVFGRGRPLREFWPEVERLLAAARADDGLRKNVKAGVRALGPLLDRDFVHSTLRR